jgi:periplasmic protein TonB
MIPGKQSGRVVRSRFTVPINFELAKETKVKINEKESNRIFDEVEQNPEFPGGMEGFGKYLQVQLRYPSSAQKANISGKVYTQFIVNKDGSTSDFKTLKGIGFGCDEEAMRVIQSVPRWNPARHKGEVVSSRFIVPINFQLSE